MEGGWVCLQVRREGGGNPSSATTSDGHMCSRGRNRAGPPRTSAPADAHVNAISPLRPPPHPLTPECAYEMMPAPLALLLTQRVGTDDQVEPTGGGGAAAELC